MKNVFACLALLAGLLTLPLSLSPARASNPSLVVVVSSSLGAKNISAADLRRAFLGLPTELGGKRLVPLNLPPTNASRQAFDRAVLGLEPSKVGAFWVDRRIRDESPPPRTVPSADLAAKVAASLPGAIAYIPPDKVNSKVVVLSIDGKAPGSAGYPFN